MVKEYELEIDKEKFYLSLYLSNDKEIIFNIINKKKMELFTYYKAFNIQKLKELNKCFIFYDSVEEILKFIQALLDDKKGQIFYENDNMVLVLSFFLPTGKQDEIKFVFEKKNLNKDEIIQNLFEKINNLENKINILINNDKKKDYCIELLEKRIKKLEDKDKQNEIEFQNIKKKSSYLEEIKESSIININEINMFLDEFQKHDNFKNKKIDFKLIYKATKDGNLLKNLHDKCDYKENCIVFIKDNNGKRFGGYTQIGFSSENEEKKDNNAFVFLLDSKKIFNIKNGETAIYCYSTSIGFKNTIYLKEGDLFNNSHTAYGDYYGMEGYELTKYYSNIKIKEIEIYQIIYN